MLALTVGTATTTTSSDMIVYNTPSAGSKDEIAAGFAIADGKVKHKGEGTRAALLALRMLWFLRPDEFVWKKAKGGKEKKVEEETMCSTQYVSEATGKIIPDRQRPSPHPAFPVARKRCTYTDIDGSLY
jgi:hypothetical protein